MEQDKNESWRSLSVRERMQIINATVLVAAAIVLYFVCFIVTLTVGMGVISAGGSMLATALALFGISGFVKGQMLEFEARVDDKIKRYDEDRERRKMHDTDRERADEDEEADKV